MDQLSQNLEQLRQLVQARIQRKLTERSPEAPAAIGASRLVRFDLDRQAESRQKADSLIQKSMGQSAFEHGFFRRLLSRLGL
jgi:hypothetical protein